MLRQSWFDQLIEGTVHPIVEEVREKFHELRFEESEIDPGSYMLKITKGDDDREPAKWEIREQPDIVVILPRIEPQTSCQPYQLKREEIEAIGRMVKYSLIDLANLKMLPKNLREQLVASKRSGETVPPGQGD